MGSSYLAIFIGGGLGSLCRYWFALKWSSSFGDFPWHTFLANFCSSFLLGFLSLYLISKSGTAGAWKLFWMVGFCGGFSTFSTFSLEAFQLIENGKLSMAMLYIACSLLLCVLAVWAGLLLGKMLIAE